jgi:DNA repair exonuclease SbcCD ATPase subunit
MNIIELKSLHFINFQSFKDKKIEFDDVTNVYGDNGIGKTTIPRGFKWLLFGKDENDRTDSGRGAFNLKPLDENGDIIHGLETIVEGEFFHNGNLKTLKRMFAEKWTKPRGKSYSVLTGNETKFWIDGVPVLAGKYKKEIDSLIDETFFKLLTDPVYFSTILPWKKRMEILENLFDKITVDEIISKDSKLESIRDLLLKNDFDDLQKKFATEKSEFNKEIEKIPIIINEKESEIIDDDFDFIRHNLKNKEKELAAIEDQLTDATKENPEIAEKKTELNVLRSKINKIETDITEQRDEEGKKLNSALRKHQSDKTELENQLKENKNKIASLENKRDVLAKDIKRCATNWGTQKAKDYSIYLAEVN